MRNTTGMSKPVSINPRIVEALYIEALALSDDVRTAFAPAAVSPQDDADEDKARVALASEGLRTTTRMMHAIAWLLNRRAWCRGEISDLQLRRHGRLSPAMIQADLAMIPLLPPGAAQAVDATRHFYARLLRIDEAWRAHSPAATGAIERLRMRLATLPEERVAS